MESRTSSRAAGSRTRSARGGGRAPEEIGTATDELGYESGSTESAASHTVSSRAPDQGNTQTQQTTGLVNKMKQGATSQLTAQKDRATEGIGTIARAVRQTTDRLRDENHNSAAEYVDKVAEQLERLSNTLGQKDVNELMADAQRFARRQPALFVGGCFAVGLLAARFLKSSREHEPSRYEWPESGASRMQASDLRGA